MDKKYVFLIILCAVILLAILLVYLSRGLERDYWKEIHRGFRLNEVPDRSILTEKDIGHLPGPVQKYLRYTGAVGREKVYNMKAIVEGEMLLDPNKGWTRIQAEQYNFFGSHPTRLFNIKTKMFGIPVLGLHTYNDDVANMRIKVAGLYTVLDSRGPEMRLGDTTTLLNDMCFFAPATLIDKRIQWEQTGDLTARAIFKTSECTVSADLYFNEKGEMVNFISEDRYYIPMDGSCRRLKWSTPMGNYIERDGRRFPGYGEAVWLFPEGEYCYGKFSSIKEVTYNLRVLK